MNRFQGTTSSITLSTEVNIYDSHLFELLDDIPNSLSPNDTYYELIELINYIKEFFENNPGKHLNELNF